MKAPLGKFMHTKSSTAGGMSRLTYLVNFVAKNYDELFCSSRAMTFELADGWHRGEVQLQTSLEELPMIPISAACFPCRVREMLEATPKVMRYGGFAPDKEKVIHTS